MRITLLLLIVGVSYTFALECGQTVSLHRHLISNDFKVTEDIQDAAYIESVTLEAKDTKCDDDGDHSDYWGIIKTKPQFWVNNGCQGLFKINYVKGICDEITLSPLRPNITLTKSCAIKSMECIRRHSDASNCTFNVDFGMIGTTAKVDNGCDCDFRICHAPYETVVTTTTTTTPAPASDNSNSTASNSTTSNSGPVSLVEFNGNTAIENGGEADEHERP